MYSAEAGQVCGREELFQIKSSCNSARSVLTRNMQDFALLFNIPGHFFDRGGAIASARQASHLPPPPPLLDR